MLIFFASFLAVGIYALAVGFYQVVRAYITEKKFEIWQEGKNKETVRGYLLNFKEQNNLMFMNDVPSRCRLHKRDGGIMILVGLFALLPTILFYSFL